MNLRGCETVPELFFPLFTNSSLRELQSQQFYAPDKYLLCLANFICTAIELAQAMDHAAAGLAGWQRGGGAPGEKTGRFVKSGGALAWLKV